MISVICVYSDNRVLNDVLLKSLGNQTVKYELIALDNRDKRFNSAAQALNYGGVSAKGDYIMFVHQDMWLGSDSWLEDVERVIESLPNLGVAGVAGMSEKGKNWAEKVKFSIDVYDHGHWEDIGRVDKAMEVQILDECILIVPRPVFNRLRFDEDIFDGWDCYGADYCLSVKKLGLKAYVIPGSCSHCCLRAGYQIWEFKELLKYHKKLYLKHRKNYRVIHTWMGDVSWASLRRREFMQVVGPVYLRLFPNMNILLKRDLSGCDSVLDLGCGHHSPFQRCGKPFSVGVELSEPVLQESRRKGIHSEYIRGDIRNLEFRSRSFDAVIALDVLQDLTKRDGEELLKKMARWARQKVIVTTPNGSAAHGDKGPSLVGEPTSGWGAKDLRAAGFEVRGIGGWKELRNPRGLIRLRPSLFWAVVSLLTQKLAYYRPEMAFQLLAIKRMDACDGVSRTIS